MLLFSACFVAIAVAQQYNYSVNVIQMDPAPVISYVDGGSDFQEVFNPGFVEASPGTNGKAGLLVRTQNCTIVVNGSCAHCSGSGSQASVMTFAQILGGGNSEESPVFSYINSSSVVFGPSSNLDLYGTEDPRVTYDPVTELYYVFYTSYGPDNVLLTEATTPNPTSSSEWTRHGPVFPEMPGSKSAALLIRPSAPHYLLWGDTVIRITNSTNLTDWANIGEILLTPRPGMFDSVLVEAGPNPMLLSTGDYLFLHNSADQTGAYHPGWVILSGENPNIILARSNSPLFGPEFAWEQGVNPYTCNVPNVAFLQGVSATEVPDVFRVYFGGADTVVGTAVVKVTF